MRQILSFLILSGFASVCFAQSSFFCEKTNTTIRLGTNINTVIQACGIPTKTETEKTTKVISRKVVQWVYDYQPHSLSFVNNPRMTRSALIIDFINLKVVGIRVKGKAVTSTDFCGFNYPKIKIGSTNLTVRQTCTAPTLVQTVNQPLEEVPVTKATLTYQFNEFLPPEKLIFENGRLTEISR